VTVPAQRLAATALLLGALSCGSGEEAVREVRPPRIVFEIPEQDFGRVDQGDAVEVEFAFVNRGDLELTLSEPRVACDSTARLSPGTEVPGGGSGVVRIRFDTSSVHGPQRRTATVYTNDPERRHVMLVFEGEVALDVVAEPSSVYVGKVERDHRVATAAVFRTGAQGAAVRSLQTDGPYVKAELSKKEKQMALSLRVRDDAPLGSFTQIVRIATSSARHPQIEVEVSGIVVEQREPSRWPRP
jgi:hypothetical protein